jgi:hypothetical protein
MTKSVSARQSRNGGRLSFSNGGAADPIGQVIGWSLVQPFGNEKLRNLSNMSSVRKGDCGCSSSDLLLSDRTNPGWIGIPPASLNGLKSNFPALAATSWTRFPPELSPIRKTRLKSALSLSHGSCDSPVK